MKNRLIPCVLACLMIFLVGCNGNTAKEAAQEITKTETSFPAGNTETNSQEDTAKKPESTAVQEETPITAKESQSTAESQTVMTVQTKPAEEKTADTPATEKPKAEPPKQTTTQAEPEKQTEQPKEQTTAEQKPVEKPTEKPAEPKPTEPHKQTFDVSPYVSYAKEYAVSIGLSLDITATECWDNPILASNEQSTNGDKYMCGFAERNDLFELCSECMVSDDYIEIVHLFGSRVANEAELFKEQVEKLDIPITLITEADCIPDHYSKDINGKIIAIDPKVLKPEFQRADRQLYYVTGGFGASANSRGSAVFCTNLHTGKSTRYERMDVMGEVKPERLPEWAKEKAQELLHKKRNKDKER